MMRMTVLGNTGLNVSRLGMGLSEIGEFPTDISEAGQLLNTALDGGINFLDTAACYGNSEELLGRTIPHRRSEYDVATKCGHVAGTHSGTAWSAQIIEDSIDRSLIRMKTDHLDLVQLHSCGLDVLEKGEAVEALMRAKEAGKARFVGYSGDNDGALWAVDSGNFDTLQTSFSLVDQQARTGLFERAKARGMGIIVKRPIANGVWGTKMNPPPYGQEYFRRAQAMARMGPIPGAQNDRIALALGFVLAHSQVDTAIVGTRNLGHLGANIEMVASGMSVETEAVGELIRRFEELGESWNQLQ